MKSFLSVTYDSNRLERWLKVLTLLAVIAGGGLRFCNLEKKAFWRDEASSAMVSTGHRIWDLYGESHGGAFMASDYLRLQKLSADRGLLHTVVQLARDDSSHSPLYYLLLRGWLSLTGDSIAAIRSFSALVSLFLIPAMFWLSFLLFGSRIAGWMGALTTAISPYQFVFAQEAREYILWLLFIVLTSIAMLQKHWRLFLFGSFLDVYSSILSVFVAAGHLCYLWFDFRKTGQTLSKKMLWIRAAAFIAAIPLLVNMWFHLPDIRRGISWMSDGPPFLYYCRVAVSNLYRVILDLNFGKGEVLRENLAEIAVLLVVPALLLGAFLYFLRHAEKRSRLFVLSLMVSILLPTLGLDLLFGGRRFLSTRFVLPFFLGVQFSVIFCLSHLLESRISQFRRYGALGTALVAILGLTSLVVRSQARLEWYKTLTMDYEIVAGHLTAFPRPIVLSDDDRESLALSHYIPRGTWIQYPLPNPATIRFPLTSTLFLLQTRPDVSSWKPFEDAGWTRESVSGVFWRLYPPKELADSMSHKEWPIFKD